MALLQKLNEARKAVVAFLVPGLALLGNALTEDSAGGSAITSSEWIAAAVASLATSGIVYQVKNGASADPTISTPDLGVQDPAF